MGDMTTPTPPTIRLRPRVDLGPYGVGPDDTLVLRDTQTNPPDDPTALPIDLGVIPFGAPVSEMEVSTDELWAQVAGFYTHQGTARKALRELRALPWHGAFITLKNKPTFASLLRDLRDVRHVSVDEEPVFAELLADRMADRLDSDTNTTQQQVADWWTDCGLINPDHENPWVASLFTEGPDTDYERHEDAEIDQPRDQPATDDHPEADGPEAEDGGRPGPDGV